VSEAPANSGIESNLESDSLFTITRPPQGQGLGPEEYRDQYVGVKLPVDSKHIFYKHLKTPAGEHIALKGEGGGPIVEAIWVQAGVIIESLPAGQLADYWLSVLKSSADRNSYLVFSPQDGELEKSNVVRPDFGQPRQRH